MVKSIARLILGFVAGTILYVVGFFAGGTLIGLANVFAILPASVNRFQWALTAVELTVISAAANLFGIWIFHKIDRNSIHRIAFSVWLIIVAAIYFTMAILNGEVHLIWYSVIGVAANGFVIFETVKEIRTIGQNGAQDEIKKTEEKLTNKPENSDLKNLKFQLSELRKTRAENESSVDECRKALKMMDRETVLGMFERGEIDENKRDEVINGLEVCECTVKNSERIAGMMNAAIEDVENEIRKIEDEH